MRGIDMKKKNVIMRMMMVSVIFVLSISTFFASSSKKTSTDRPVKTSEAEANLSDLQKVMQAESYSEALQWDDLDGEAEAYISGVYSKETLMFLLNTGRMLGYLDDFKAAGLVDQNYTSPYLNSSNSSSSSAAKEEVSVSVTTTKCEEKTMWVKSQVNVRENGSISYKKVGSLKKDEQVTVTGIDSTGWYEIRLSDGTVGHVSDKYLTEVDPSVNTVSTETQGETPQETPTESASPKKESKIISIDGRTVVWYNAETDREEEVTFNEATPLDEVEEMANAYLIHGAELVESTPESTEEPEESPEVTAEISETSDSNKKDETIGMETGNDNAEEEKEETEISGQTDNKITEEHNISIYWIAGAVVLIVLLIGGGVVAYKKSHRNK